MCLDNLLIKSLHSAKPLHIVLILITEQIPELIGKNKSFLIVSDMTDTYGTQPEEQSMH